MYYKVIHQCAESLRVLETCLDKTEQLAVAKGVDADAFMSRRLAPNMQPFTYQVQSACDYLKAGAAWLSGQAPPKHADMEQSINDIRARIKKTLDFVHSVEEARYRDAAQRKMALSWAPGKVINGENYLLQITIPNVFFHIGMAYAILRHYGVDIGKMDFLGRLSFEDIDPELATHQRPA
jgi:hypothetical protein